MERPFASFANLVAGSFRTGKARTQRGFTLIELMVVVAIMAILAAIALPSYRKHILHANRAAAISLMYEMAGAQERYMTDNRAFAASKEALGYPSPLPNNVSNNYNIVVAQSAGPPPSYTITATPTGGQVNDTDCGTLTLSSDGTPKASGPSADCWK